MLYFKVQHTGQWTGLHFGFKLVLSDQVTSQHQGESKTNKNKKAKKQSIGMMREDACSPKCQATY